MEKFMIHTQRKRYLEKRNKCLHPGRKKKGEGGRERSQSIAATNLNPKLNSKLTKESESNERRVWTSPRTVALSLKRGRTKIPKSSVIGFFNPCDWLKKCLQFSILILLWLDWKETPSRDGTASSSSSSSGRSRRRRWRSKWRRRKECLRRNVKRKECF